VAAGRSIKNAVVNKAMRGEQTHPFVDKTLRHVHKIISFCFTIEQPSPGSGQVGHGAWGENGSDPFLPFSSQTH